MKVISAPFRIRRKELIIAFIDMHTRLGSYVVYFHFHTVLCKPHFAASISFMQNIANVLFNRMSFALIGFDLICNVTFKK